MLTVEYPTLTAHLCPMTGEGLLVLPHPCDDVPSPVVGGASLQAADWHHALADLELRGWEPSEAEDGGLIDVGTTADNRQVVGLYGREPVVSMPSIE